MEHVRETWTDERLDDLNHRVDGGFRETRDEIRSVRGEMDALRAETNALRAEMNTRFDAMNARFDAMQRTMIQGFVGMTAAIVAALIGLIATQL
ncbi:MAG: hypothetical protein WD827_07440 [Solirubrobacterales bacterium]